MDHDSLIAVGVDGSEASLHALDWAVAQAKARDARLLLVCAYTLPAFSATALDGGFAALDDAAIRRGAELVLADAEARVGTVPVETRVVLGDPAGSLVDVSHEVGLIVVGSRGHGGFAGRLLGSVSSALPAHAWCPTVVVPLRSGPVPDRPSRIVVGVDGSRQAGVALKHAVDEALRWDAELVAVAAVPVGHLTSALGRSTGADPDQVIADYEQAVAAAVEEATRDHPQLRVRRVVLDGTGAAMLIEFSSTADLVVVGSRGRGGFVGLLLGSTSQAVLHHAASPVCVVTDRCESC
jgi:nucleotide-binding universal stress UspA family protein